MLPVPKFPALSGVSDFLPASGVVDRILTSPPTQCAYLVTNKPISNKSVSGLTLKIKMKSFQDSQRPSLVTERDTHGPAQKSYMSMHKKLKSNNCITWFRRKS
jgi:hypothetical protein